MAHEIAHVAARHGTKQATRGEIAQMGMIAAAMVVPYGWAGYAAMQGSSMAIAAFLVECFGRTAVGLFVTAFSYELARALTGHELPLSQPRVPPGTVDSSS